MPRCNINLAEGIIWLRRKRLLAYRLLMLYLFVMAFLLLLMGELSIRKIRDGIWYYRQSCELQEAFTQRHPAAADILDHAKGLKKRLELDAARIESIDHALPPSILTPLPALVLLANQPDQTMLHKFSFSQETKKNPVRLRFDLITPVASRSGASSTAAFLKKWKNDPVLVHQFPEIKQLQVRRAELASGPVFITQYEAPSKD